MTAAFSYAEGGRLAQFMGGWQTICWALVLAAPFLILPVAIAVWQHGLNASPTAWLGFAYVSIISQFLAFFAWYQGLAKGGVARVGQIQLLQPLSWKILRERENGGVASLPPIFPKTAKPHRNFSAFDNFRLCITIR